MEIQINNKHRIQFERNSDGEWYGKTYVGPVGLEFTIEESSAEIDWTDIKDRIAYYLEHYKRISEKATEAIHRYQKNKLGWEKTMTIYLDCITLPTAPNREDDFIIEPYLEDDPYVSWAVHIYDEGKPKIRKVIRE